MVFELLTLCIINNFSTIFSPKNFKLSEINFKAFLMQLILINQKIIF
jgi:hypothetical protein